MLPPLECIVTDGWCPIGDKDVEAEDKGATKKVRSHERVCSLTGLRKLETSELVYHYWGFQAAQSFVARTCLVYQTCVPLLQHLDFDVLIVFVLG